MSSDKAYFKEQLFSVLLYEDEKCKCWFSKVLHFDLKIGNRMLQFVLTVHPYTPTLYATCKDKRFSYSEDGVCPPLKLLDNKDEWITFSQALAKKLTKHFLKIALPLVLPRQPMFKIEFTDNNATYMNSKLGGSFFWPNDTPPSLRFLVQINLSELPENNVLPKSGILQFFIGNDDSFGLSDGKDGYQVVYHEDISSGRETMQFFVDDCCDVFDKEGDFAIKDSTNDYTPIRKPCGMAFTLTEEFMSINDFRFEKYLGELADEDDDVLEPIFEMFSSQGSKLMGYPFFTQYDPRTFLGDNKKYNTLLLQLDGYDGYTEWGDGGVCNFFINDKALKNADFSDVLYSWDCY